VKELEKLYSVQVKRVVFMLVFKYGAQMNVQVSLFMLKGAIQKGIEFNYIAAFGELFSLGAMMLGIASEFYDLKTLLLTFWDIRSSVCDCFQKKKEDDEAEQKDGNQNWDIQSSVCECFKTIRSSVCACFQKKQKKEDLLARHFFKDGDDDKEEDLTFADLNIEYYRIFATTVCIVLVTAFAMYLIGYEILKFLLCL